MLTPLKDANGKALADANGKPMMCERTTGEAETSAEPTAARKAQKTPSGAKRAAARSTRAKK